MANIYTGERGSDESRKRTGCVQKYGLIEITFTCVDRLHKIHDIRE